MKEPYLSKEALDAWRKQIQNPPIRRVKLGAPQSGLPKELIADAQRLRDGHESHINKAINELAAHLAGFARLVDETYKGDTNRIRAIEKRVGIDLTPYRAADWEKTIRDEDRAKLRAFVDNPGRIDDLIEILLEIGATK